VIKTLTRSFAGGVITPEMFGRLDLTRYQTALAEAQNFLIYPHGPAANRPGTEYVLEVKASSKRTVLMPFIYSTTQSYALEFGEGYIRIHTQGGTVLEAAKNITAITQANPGVATSAGHGFANGNCLFLAGIGGMTQLNGRFVLVAGATANTFQLTDLAGNNINTSAYTAYTAGGTASRVYEVSTPYVEADLLDLHFTQSADVLTIVHPSYQQRELRRLAATNWTLTALSFTPTQSPPTAPVATPNPAGAITYTYVVTAIANDGQEESLPCAEFSCAGNLTGAGALNALSWADPAGVTRFNCYKKVNGLFGFIGQAGTGGVGFNDTNITPDMSKTPPISNDPFTSATNYPGEVAYFQGRRWFAATTTKPQNIWATVSGTESNMSYSIPTRDSDALAFRIAFAPGEHDRHLVPLTEMLISRQVASGTWRQPGSGVITPSHGRPAPGRHHRREQRAAGDDEAPRLSTRKTAAGACARCSSRGSSRTTRPKIISIMAPHYFDGYTINADGIRPRAAPDRVVRALGRHAARSDLRAGASGVSVAQPHDGRHLRVVLRGAGRRRGRAVCDVNARLTGARCAAVERLRTRFFTELSRLRSSSTAATYDASRSDSDWWRSGTSRARPSTSWPMAPSFRSRLSAAVQSRCRSPPASSTLGCRSPRS
jgi:hypothetical protein